MTDTTSDATQPASVAAATSWLARIHVTLRPVVLDPQGEAVLHGLQQLGYSSVAGVRVGKYLEVRLTAGAKQEAEEAVRQMCERLLANPVIERYDFTVAESAPTSE